jgi:hypothetical protein
MVGCALLRLAQVQPVPALHGRSDTSASSVHDRRCSKNASLEVSVNTAVYVLHVQPARQCAGC